MKYVIFAVLNFCVIIKGTAQDSRLEFCLGYGLFSMHTLKVINEEVLSDLPFTAKIIHSFPPSIFYRSAILFRTDSILSIGLNFSYSSTGSRISRKDYSGEYRFDQIISSVSPGVAFRAVISNRKIKIEQYTNVNYSHTRLQIEESLIVGTDPGALNTTYYSTKFFETELGMSCYYSLGSYSFGFFGGYLFCLDFDFGILPRINHSLAGWNGLRFGLFSSYKLY